MIESLGDLYQVYRKTMPKGVAMLEPKRFVLGGNLSQNYCSPSQVIASDILATQMLASKTAIAALLPDSSSKLMHQLFYFHQTSWIQCGAPVYFLAPDIGEALIDTEPPPHLSISEIRWPYPAIRVFLPKGFLHFQGCYQSHINIAFHPKGRLTAHVPLLDEINQMCATAGQPQRDSLPGVEYIHPTISIGWNEEIEQGFCGSIPNGINIPFTEETIGDVLAIFAEKGMSGPADRIFKLAINLIMLLSWTPDEIGEERLMRKAQTNRKGEITRTELWSPRFIGRPVFGPTKPKSGESNGTQFFDQVRRAHWKRQVCGPSRSERRLKWISLYRTRSREERGLPED